MKIRIRIPPNGDISTFEMVSIVIVVATFILLLLSSLLVLRGSELQLAYPVILVVVFVLSLVLRVVGKKRRKLNLSEIEKF